LSIISTFSGKEDAEVLDLAWINSHHQSGFKNILDVAVIRFAQEQRGVRTPQFYKKVDELPFDFVRRRMSVIVENIHGEHVLVCKGAVEETLGISAFVRNGKQPVPLDDAKRQELMAMTRDYKRMASGSSLSQRASFRAGRPKLSMPWPTSSNLPCAVSSPSSIRQRKRAGPAIAALREHGIKIIILTGDNPVVTRKVCRDVGPRSRRSGIGK
jgi:Mg2+-importing ATPase